MKKYKVVIVSRGTVMGADLTEEEAEKLAEQVRMHRGLTVVVKEDK
jgi:hypothetical protein